MSYYDVDKYPNDLNASTSTTTSTTVSWPKPHIGNSSEFIASGWPYSLTVTSTTTVTLPYVSKWVCISAINCDVEVSFEGGSAVFIIPSGTNSGQLELKCSQVTLNPINVTPGAKASLICGLTNIPGDSFPDVSSWDGIV